ncbi:hypothetical protein CF326_g2595 [Tilletia indica]|nr:hypothetical protein CF326_g2595 [Tilletia indica]
MFHVNTGNAPATSAPAPSISHTTADIQSFYLTHQDINAANSPKLANALAEYINSWSQEDSESKSSDPHHHQQDATASTAYASASGHSHTIMQQTSQQVFSYNNVPFGTTTFDMSNLPRAMMSKAPMQTNRLPHRSLRACKRCRHGKQKCNGEFPCMKCVARGHECIYEDRPLKKPSDTAAASASTGQGAKNDNTTSTNGIKQSEPGAGKKRKLTISTSGISAFDVNNSRFKMAKPNQQTVDPARNMGNAYGHTGEGSLYAQGHQHQQMHNHHHPQQQAEYSSMGSYPSTATSMMHNPSLMTSAPGGMMPPFQPHHHNVSNGRASSSFEQQVAPLGHAQGQFSSHGVDQSMHATPAYANHQFPVPQPIAEMHYAQPQQHHQQQQKHRYASSHGHMAAQVGSFQFQQQYSHSGSNFTNTPCSTPDTWQARHRSGYLTPDVSYHHITPQHHQQNLHGHHLNVPHHLGTSGYHTQSSSTYATPLSTAVNTPTSEFGPSSVQYSHVGAYTSNQPSQLRYEQSGYDSAPPSAISPTHPAPVVRLEIGTTQSQSHSHSPNQSQSQSHLMPTSRMTSFSTVVSPEAPNSSCPPSPALTMATSSQMHPSTSSTSISTAATSVVHLHEQREESNAREGSQTSTTSLDGSSAAGVSRRKDDVVGSEEDRGRDGPGSDGSPERSRSRGLEKHGFVNIEGRRPSARLDSSVSSLSSVEEHPVHGEKISSLTPPPKRTSMDGSVADLKDELDEART